jgi:ABC-type bacteriocin/lantibiotic exporter with double-glycine peptidase domain
MVGPPESRASTASINYSDWKMGDVLWKALIKLSFEYLYSLPTGRILAQVPYLRKIKEGL